MSTRFMKLIDNIKQEIKKTTYISKWFYKCRHYLFFRGSFATAAGGRKKEQKELSSGQNIRAYLYANDILGTTLRSDRK